MKLKRPARIFIYFTAGAVLAVVIIYFSARAGLFNQRIRDFALKTANGRLDGEFELQDLTGNPLNRFTLTGLRIRDPEGATLLSINEAVIEWEFFPSASHLIGVDIKATRVIASVIKENDVWNWRRLRKKKEGPKKPKGRLNLPPMHISLLADNSRLYFMYPPNYEIRSDLPLLKGAVETGGHAISFSLEDLRGMVEDPAVGINHLGISGLAASLRQGWAYTFHSGRLITATSDVDLESGVYNTGTGELAAEFARFELAPDALAIVWPGHPIGIPVTGKGWAQGGRKKVEFEATVHSSAGDLDTDGRFDREKRAVRIQGDMTDFSIGEFFAQKVELSGLNGGFQVDYFIAGQAEGDTAAQGPKGQRKAKLVFDLTSFKYPQIKSFPLRAEADLSGDEYAASIISGSTGTDMSLFASGEVIKPYPIEVLATMRDVNPSDITEGGPDASMAGTFRMKGEGSSAEDFQANGSLTLEPTKFMNFDVLNAGIVYTYSGKRLSISDASVLVEDIRVIGTGWVDPLGPEVPYNFDLTAEPFLGGLLYQLSGSTVSVQSFTVETRLSGKKERWNAKGSLSAKNLNSQWVDASELDSDFELSGRGGAELSGGFDITAAFVNVPDAGYRDLRLPVFDMVGDVTINPSPPSRPDIVFDIDLDPVDPDYDLNAEGEFSYPSEGQWKLDLNSLYAELTGRTWQMQKPLQIRQRNGGIWLSGLTMEHQEESFELEGQLTGNVLDFNFAATNLEVRPWAEKIIPGDTLEGIFTGELSVKGPPANPEVHLVTDWRQPQYLDVELDYLNGSVDYVSETMTLNLEGRSGTYGKLDGEGQIPMVLSISPGRVEPVEDRQMSVDITAEGISVSLLMKFLPWITDLSGRMSLVAKIRGTPATPEWNGNIQAREVRMKVPQWGLSLKELSGTADIVDNRVTIPRLQVKSGDGTARLSGGFDLEGYSVSSMDLKLKADDFRAMNTPETRAVLDADLALTGDPSYPKLDGDVTFVDLTYRPPLILAYKGTAWETDDPTIVVKGEQQEESTSSPWLDRSSINLEIDIPDTAKLRNSELNLMLGGELTLRKPPGGFFLLFGEIRAKEGWIIFQNKVFSVQKGVFTFPAIPVIDPDINLLASYRAREYTTFIHVTGSLSEPRLEMYSEPPLPPEDVLSVILFGRPASDLTEGESSALRSTGAQLVGEFAAAKLGKAFPVDAIVVEAGETYEQSGVGVGKYINSRLYVFYYHTFGEDRAEEFRVRYELTRELSIEAGQDAEGQGGADIYFSYPY